jgi:magnesium-transporting ATPase (P-type)
MLPMIVTANLAKGAIAMSRKRVIVKRLHAIQNFGEAEDDAALARITDTYSVFAKVTPAQKARLIAACQQNGHVVGFSATASMTAPR